MNVTIEGQIDHDLYVKSIQAAKPELRIVAVSVMVVIGLLVALTADGGSGVSTAAVLLLVVAGLGAALVGLLLPRLIAARALKTGASVRAPFSGHASADRIVLRTEFGTSDLPWSVFYQAVVGDDHIVLLQSANLMNVLDRSFVTDDEQWSALTSWVTEHVPARRRPRWIRPLMVIVGVVAVLTIMVIVFA